MEQWLYSDVVKEHFMNPKNVLMEDEDKWPCDGRGIVGNIKCGDQMLILLRIKDDIIEDVRWKTYGCASAIASSSALTELIKGKSVEEASKITNKDIAAYLGGLPKEKINIVMVFGISEHLKLKRYRKVYILCRQERTR